MVRLVTDGATRSARFVGRGAQLDVLRAAFEEAVAGRGSLVFVGGESGIGKSRIASEFVAFARARNAAAGFGRCLDYAPAPFAPLHEALAEADIEPPASDDRNASFAKRELFARLLECLRTATSRAPLVLALDDFQWADESTRDFVRYLSDGIGTLRVVCCLTYRTGEALPIAMRDTLASLQRGAATHLLELEPLSDFEMRALLRNAVEGRRQSVAMRLDELSALAEGNPLVAEELVRSLLAGDGSRPADLPVSEREAVLRRYDALPPQDRDLLSRAAVIGREFTSEFLARVGRASLDGVIGTVKRAIAASLVVERARGTYAFRHERTRHIILGTLLAEEVRLFHARIASELEAPTSGDVADTVLAHHWWEAGDHARASVYAERWGDAAAAAGAFDDAARAYERVDRHEANAGSVGAFALKYGEALHFAGRAEDAAQYATQAFEAFASAGDPSTIRALLLRSAVADDLGDAASALSDAKRAFDLATANDGDDDLRFRAATLLALAGEAADDSAIVAVRAEAARRGDVRTFRDIDVRLALRRTATAMKSDALREARVHFDAAVAAAAGDPRARRRLHASGAALGAAFEAVRAPDDALAVYRAAECDDADRLDVPVRNRQGRTRDELTKREREVAERVAQGKSNKTIGAELFVSERTVEDHVGAMLRKLSLKNRAELAARIARDQPSPDRAT